MTTLSGQATVSVTVLVLVTPPGAVIRNTTVHVPVKAVGNVTDRPPSPDIVIPVPEATYDWIGQAALLVLNSGNKYT